MDQTADIVLKFETLPGRAPKLEAVTRALDAWGEMLRTAAEIAEPGSIPSIELVGVEDGSQVFKIALKKLQEFGATVSEGAAEYPIPKKLAIALSGSITTGLVAVGLQAALLPTGLPDDQMEVFKETNRLLTESVDLQRKNKEFYEALQEEPAYTAVKVLEGEDGTVLYEVPKSEFATRSGVWGEEEDDDVEQPETQVRTATWDVVLIKPVLEARPRRWVFAREGLKFSALMSDKRVLEAVHDKTLPIQVAEGISMKIEVQYKERFNGQAWEPIDKTRKVTRVLHPQLLSTPGPLFLPPGRP